MQNNNHRDYKEIKKQYINHYQRLWDNFTYEKKKKSKFKKKFIDKQNILKLNKTENDNIKIEVIK